MIIALAFAQLSRSDDYLRYEVRTNDTLSEILSGLGICPVWGQKSMIKKTTKLNKDLIKKHGHLIRTKRIITLPVTSLPENQDYALKSDLIVEFVSNSPRNKCKTINRQVAQVPQKRSTVIPSKIEEPITEERFLEEGPNSFGVLKIFEDVYFSAMDLTDKNSKDKAELLSRVNQATQVNWEQVWDEKNKSLLYYRSDKQSYDPFENKFSGKSLNLLAFGIGYERGLSKNSSLALSLGIQEKAFLRAINANSLKLERAMVPTMTLNYNHKLVSKGKFELFGDIGAALLMSTKTSNYSIKSGQRYGAGIAVVQKLKDFELKGRGFYNIENQDTSIMTKKMKELGVSISLSWSFGK